MQRSWLCRVRLFAITLFLSVMALSFMAGCGGSSSGSSTPVLPGNPGGGPTPTPTPPPPGGGPGTPPPATVAFVYVGNAQFNAPGQIAAFSVGADSAVHSVTGSPFSGASASPVVTSSNLFATDGTNIQTYTRNADGSLVASTSIVGTAHNDTPQGSGVGPLTLDRTGRTLYAGENSFQGADNDAYAEFSVGQGGKLTWFANTPISTDYNKRLVFSQNDQFAYGFGCFFINWDVFGLFRATNGTLAPISTGANPPTPPDNFTTYCPGPIAASANNFLAVIAGVTGSSAPPQLLTYHINSDGSLAMVQNSAQAFPIAGASAMAFDPSGNFLALAGQNGIQMYQLAPGGTLVAVGTPQQTTASFNDVAWDHANHLYAISGSTLYVFNLANGALTQAPGSPYNVTVSGTLAVLPTT